MKVLVKLFPQDIVGDKLCRLFEKQVEIEQQFAGK